MQVRMFRNKIKLNAMFIFMLQCKEERCCSLLVERKGGGDGDEDGF